MFEAARVTDPIEHTSALTGFLIGAVLGIALIAAVAFATLTCGFGIALVAGMAAGIGAAGLLAAGEMIGRMCTTTSGQILTGSANVFTNSLPAAFVENSAVQCSKHNPTPLVAEGSTNVFINGKPAARKGDSITCGAKIAGGSSNVFIGGGTKRYLEVDDEVPPWLRTAVDWAFALAGLVGGLGGLVRKMGGLSRAVLPCAAKFVAGFAIGEAVGRYVVPATMRHVFGGHVGHPVEVTTGRKILLAQDEIDFVVPSPIPLEIGRFYASNLVHEGTLGQGWVLPWELRLQARNGQLWYTDAQGRESGFPIVPPGHSAFDPSDQRYLACTPDGRFILYDLSETYYDFGQLDTTTDKIAWLQRIEDLTGQWQTFERDDQGSVLRIQTSGGEDLKLSYLNVKGRLTGIERMGRGQRGQLLKYEYDAEGQLVRVIDPNGQVSRRFAYAEGLMISHINALGFECRYRWQEIEGQRRVVVCGTSEGEQTEFHYDIANRQTRIVDELGRTAKWTYDEHFQVTACIDLDGSRYRIEYTEGGQPKTLHLPGDRVAEFGYDEAGRLVIETDPLGRVTKTRYHRNGLRVRELTLPDGSHWQAEYDAIGRLLATNDPIGRSERYEYPEGITPWPVAHVDAKGGRRTMTWNRLGQIASSTDCSGKTTRYLHDVDGLLAGIVNALGEKVGYERLRTGEPIKVTLPDGSTEEFRYDAAGLLIEHRDPIKQVSRWQRNARGQVLASVDPAQRGLRYEYDARGRLTELAAADDTRYRFSYDEGDRLARERRPDGIERAMTYDAAGELQAIVTTGSAAQTHSEQAECSQRTTRFERDAMGRLLSQSTTTATLSYSWDAGDRLRQADRWPTAAGSALGIQPNTVRFDYDAAGRLIAEHGVDGSVSYALDELDVVTSLALPHGPSIKTLTYGSGHVHQIRSGEQVISDFERDDLHREVMRTQGRLTQCMGYDALGRRTWQSAGTSPDALAPGRGRLWRSYRYHPSGELAQQHDSLRGAIDYRYDPAGHLLDQQRQKEVRAEQFAWDAAGNLLNRLAEGSRKSSGRVEGNRLMAWQDIRFEYDAWGNLSRKASGSRQVQRFDFDAEDRLIRVRTESNRGTVETSFDYDALGRRVGKIDRHFEVPTATPFVERVRFVWQGLRMVQEVRATGVSSFVYSPDAAYTPLARIDSPRKDAPPSLLAKVAIEPARPSARVLHFHTDLVGAPLEVTDEAGELAWAGRYTAWGKADRQEPPLLTPRVEQPLRYPGQYADQATGLHYNTFRFYDPDIGRFISQDPIGLGGGQNLYSYTPNPTGWMDATGWCGEETNWGAYLRKLGGGEPPAGMLNPHAHHIVFKNGRGSKMRALLDESKAILEKHKLDWLFGKENLTWAPNKNHSTAAAEAVRDALVKADKAGTKAEISDALATLGKHFANDTISTLFR